MRVLTLGVLFLFLWKFFWMVYTAIFIGLIAVLLAIVIHSPAKWLERWIPFRVGISLSILVFLASLVGLFLAVIPQVLEQFAQLATQLPGAWEQATDWLRSRSGSMPNNEFEEQLNQQLGDFVGRFVPLAFNLISVFVAGFAVIILAIFLALEPQVYRNLVLRLSPAASRDRAERVYDSAGRSLRYWVLGKAATMVMVGIVTWIGLRLFGIPGALALATLAAVLEFIPNFGPTIAAAPAIIAAFAISPFTALYVTLFYFVLQQVQSALTVPLVERRAVDIPPAALLIWQLMLAVGFGIIGLFVATPLLAVIVIFVRIMYVEPAEARQEWDRRDSQATAAQRPHVASGASAVSPADPPRPPGDS